MRDLEAAWKEVPAEDDAQKSLRPLVQAVVRTDNSLQRSLEVLRDYQAARKDFTARRYGGEANTNRATAGPYELRVYKAGDTSDRYRIRSQRFFSRCSTQLSDGLGRLETLGNHWRQRRNLKRHRSKE